MKPVSRRNLLNGVGMKLPVGWIKNSYKNKQPWFFDGDEFLVATLVGNRKDKTEKYEYAHIKISCDEDYFDIKYANSDEFYDAWQFTDFDYYIPVGDTQGPMTKKQMEACT